MFAGSQLLIIIDFHIVFVRHVNQALVGHTHKVLKSELIRQRK